MNELVKWLRGVLSEVDQRACLAGGDTSAGCWHTGSHSHDSSRVEDGTGNIVVYDEGSPSEEEAAHIAGHDPASALAQVAADRKILELWRVSRGADFPDFDGGYAQAMDHVVKLRAEAHASRPGYREEWRP